MSFSFVDPSDAQKLVQISLEQETTVLAPLVSQNVQEQHPGFTNTSGPPVQPRPQSKKKEYASFGSKFESEFFWNTSFPVGPIFLDQHSSQKFSLPKDLMDLLPTQLNVSELFPGREKGCAIVTGSRELMKNTYGTEIDSYPVVLRLNLYQLVPNQKETQNYGAKTTHRMINNIFWSNNKKGKVSFEKFANMKGIVVLNHVANNWIPSHPTTGRKDLTQVITDFLRARLKKKHLDQSLVLHPDFVNAAFLALTEGVKKRISSAPSTGFIAMVMLSRICGSVHGYGFTPVAKTPINMIPDEHKIYERWRDDVNATVRLFLHP